MPCVDVVCVFYEWFALGGEKSKKVTAKIVCKM